MILGSRLSVLLLSAALAFACKRERDDGRPPAEAKPTAAQQEGRSPAEAPSASESSRRANRQRRAAARASTVRHVAGTLEHRSVERVVIRGPGEERVTLQIARGTEITLDGRPATLEALREGSAVRAAYESGHGERPTALSIEGRSSDERGVRRAPDARWVPNTGERGSADGG
ncbi:MAG TPA: hypothetical protein VLC54_12210 [Anaeromyxobacter sp.]|nr:hypothetical protein [Anaeromyxobacter sp.]